MMTEPDFTKFEHVGQFLTKVDKRDDGHVVIVQTSRRGIPDIVILPADLALALAKMILADTRRAA